MYGGAPVQPIIMNFGAAQDIDDVINRAKFFFDRFKGFGLRKGQIWEPPVGNRNGPHHCVLR